MFKRNHFLAVVLMFVITVPAVGTLGAKDLDDYRDRSTNAAKVLGEIMTIREDGIPEELMAHAKAVAVIPHVVKGALGLGGQYGKGLVSTRLENGRWSTPSFVDIGGGSFGLQIGVQATDLILVFTDDSGFRGLLKGKVKLGADASVAAGPVGRKAEVGTDVLLKSGVFAYSRSKGLFAGISLDGSAVTINDSANEAVYGKEVTAQDILLRGRVSSNDVVAPFMQALERYSPARAKRVSEN
jgi:lipid-binding SYLF domain-containing protein